MKELVGTTDQKVGEKLLSLPRPTPFVDWAATSAWLSHCDKNHISQFSSSRMERLRSLKSFRVIDARKRCVVTAPVDCKFAALSYVWGRADNFLQATTKNINTLGVEGSLIGEAKLPATIDDAIDVCCSLNIPFLWVDRMCILQDEAEDVKAIHLKIMGDIYSLSYVTLAALAGDNADYGLPGTCRSGREPLWCGKIQGMYLLEKADGYETLLANSKWQTRGWTFQEAILASRLLLFSDKMVFYECHHKLVIEDQDNAYNPVSIPSDMVKAQLPIGSYNSLVQAYTKRQLTHKSDILNAFSGILHTVYGSQHLCGLPFDGFSRAILWKTADGKYPLRYEPPMSYLPSWSWCSTVNEILLQEGDYDQYGHISASLAQWAVASFKDKKPSLTILPNVSKENLVELRWSFGIEIFARRAVLIAWKEGCFPGEVPNELVTNNTWEEYDDIINKRWNILTDMCDEAHGLQGGFMTQNWKRIQVAISPDHFQTLLNNSCIVVYTQSQQASIRMRERDQDYVLLRNKENHIIGWLQPGSVNWERLSQIHHEQDYVELHVLALSIPAIIQNLGGPDIPIFQTTSEPELTNWSDSKGRSMLFISSPMRNVREFQINLMVVWTDKGISRRVALGRSYLKTWVEFKPEFHFYILA